MKTYRLPLWLRILWYIGRTIATIYAIFFVFSAVATLIIGTSVGLKLLDVAMAVLFVLLLYIALRELDTIVIQDNGLITFRSPIRQITISPSEVKSIKSPFLNGLRTTIKHTRGTIQMYRVADFYDFIHTVKSLNPEVQVKVFDYSQSS